MSASKVATHNSATGTFDIRNFTDQLTPTKNKNRYLCPVCGGNNFTIKPQDGAYQCWNGCLTKEIREALAPWDEVSSSRPQQHLPKSKSKLSPKPKEPTSAPIPNGDYSLARLPNPIESPARVKKGNSIEITYPYSETQWVLRIEKPDGSKLTIPYHINANGEAINKKGDNLWLPYRMDEVRAYGSGKWILGVEGEKCVETSRQLDLVSFTFQGASWGESDLIQSLQAIKDAGVVGVVYFPDYDNTGYEKALKLENAANIVGLPFILLDPVRLWAECPDSGDIADWVELDMNIEEFVRRLEAEVHQVAYERQKLESLYIKDAVETKESISPNQNFLQFALKEMYGEKPWISADNKLYYYTGNHYKHAPDSLEIPKIASFCNSYAVVSAEGEVLFPYAKPSKVDEVLKWVKYRLGVDPESLNPPGLNCTNGVIKVNKIGNNPVVKLHPHTPDNYFIYEPLVEYNPEASPADCDRLLSCLDKPQQEILIRTLAAAIDITMVRQFRGREVRLLLASGLGSNGKDSLREVVSTIFGHSGMTSLSLADFASYDDGRKFGLAPLMNSRVNWASENPQTARLDKIQSLKLFATGNNLHCERKGKDHIEFTPKGIGIFNINEPPSLQGTMQAIQDRIAVIEFRKTFKKNPDPNNPNELHADPRFAYDPEFVRNQVAPAFLNKMLDALQSLIAEGIDYECTSDAFRSMQKENNHLFQFLEDTNIGYKPDGTMSAKELWSFLEKWYIDNGTLTLEDDGKRRTWIDQVKPSDKNVKGINQIIPRIMTLFPKAIKATRYDETAKRNVPIIKGIGIIENSRTTVENSRTTSAPGAAPETTLNQDFRTTCTTFHNEEESEKKIVIEQQCPSVVKQPEEETIPETGASGAEPSDTNTCNQQQWCESAAKKLDSGAGNDDVAVLGSSQLLAEAIVEMDGEVIEVLAGRWSDEFKVAVLSRLSLSDKKAVQSLAPSVFPAMPTKTKPEELQIATAEQIQVGINVWVFRVIDKEWLPGVVEDIDTSIWDESPTLWVVKTNCGHSIKALSLERLRLSSSRREP